MTGAAQPDFRAFVIELQGDEGRAWVASLPEVLGQLAASWALELGPELPGGLLSCVVSATTAAGEPVVVKLPSPWDRGVDERECLRRWAGIGAPALLRVDDASGAFLLERIVPGTTVVDAAAADAASLLQQLQIARFDGLRDLVETVGARLDRAAAGATASEAKLSWARAAVSRLAIDAPPPVLVHGDFDERNLLRCARRGLCAIDPLPAAGDGLYDAAYWVHATGRPGRRARFEAMAAALGLTSGGRARLRDWCGVIGVHR